MPACNESNSLNDDSKMKLDFTVPAIYLRSLRIGLLNSHYFFTLFVVPVAYKLLAKNTGSPSDVSKKLEQEIAHFNAVDD